MFGNIFFELKMFPTNVTLEFPQARVSEDVLAQIRLSLKPLATLQALVRSFPSMCKDVLVEVTLVIEPLPTLLALVRSFPRM